MSNTIKLTGHLCARRASSYAEERYWFAFMSTSLGDASEWFEVCPLEISCEVPGDTELDDRQIQQLQKVMAKNTAETFAKNQSIQNEIDSLLALPATIEGEE